MAPRLASRDEAAYTAIITLVLYFIIIAARHTHSYFFLFDDFALVAAAETSRPFEIFTQPLFGFFRPLAFLSIQPLFAVVGWTVAWPYAAFAVAVHLLNSILVFSLAVRLGLPRLPAALGATLFLLSASAAESYFWLSAVFDRLATTSLLLCIHVGISFCRSVGLVRAAKWLIPGMLAGMAAALCKETGVLAPVVVLATVRLDDRVPLLRSLVYASCLVLASAVYLTVRHRLLPGLGGTYGPFGDLVGKADLFKNLLTYARSSVVVPLPASDEAHAMYTAGALAIAPAALLTAWAALLLWCVQRRLRWLLLCATSWAAVILPVLWTPITPGSSAGGRFLYTAGIWIALTIAGAAEGIRLVSASRWTRARAIITACSVAIVFLYHTASVAYQARIWAQASLLSRAAIEQLRPYQGSGKNVYIPNMPFWFVEGPYVLKDYAFTSYFGSRFGTTVRARPMVVSWKRGEVWFAGWAVNQRSEQSTHDEVTLPLALPIRIPTPQPQAEIISPRVGASLKQPFRMLGWAVDTGAIDGCGVDSVHIWAHPEDRGPAFLGVAETGKAMQEAEGRVGTRYGRCGWSFRVQGLETGRYLLAVHPHDTVTGGFTAASVVSVQIR